MIGEVHKQQEHKKKNLLEQIHWFAKMREKSHK